LSVRATAAELGIDIAFFPALEFLAALAPAGTARLAQLLAAFLVFPRVASRERVQPDECGASNRKPEATASPGVEA
jgi:hypothetical protein